MPYSKKDKNIFSGIKKIISLNGEIFVQHYIQRSIDAYYFIQSVDELENLLNRATANDFVTIYKEKQLPCRGVLGTEFKEKVLLAYMNYDYAFYNYVLYPKVLESYGAGSDLQELNQDLNELLHDFGKDNLQLCFGADPRPLCNNFALGEDEEIIIISGE